MDIETAATSEIKNRIANTDLLSQFINEGDKEPVWDGFIYAYRNKSKRNDDSFLGRAPVQVKGHETTRFNKKSITYSVRKSNLISYRNDGGVIYFVVYVANDGRRKIYYSSLLPYVLNRYIEWAGNKKSYSITLKELSDKPNDFENLVINFIRDKNKQAISKSGKNWTIDEVMKLLGKDNCKLTSQFTAIGYDANDPFTYLKAHDTYLYIQNDDGTLTFPVEYVENVEVMATERELDVIANGTLYYTKVRWEKHKDKTMVIGLGKSFDMYFHDGRSTFKYRLKGNLKERISSMRFLKDVFQVGGFYLNTVFMPITPTKKELDSFAMEDLERILSFYLKVEELMNKLGVKQPLEMDQASNKDERNLELFIDALVYGENVRVNEKDLPPLAIFDVVNIHLMVIVNKLSDGSYKMEDYFRTNVPCALDEKGVFDTSQFCLMTADNYLKASNIDIDVVKNSFMQHRNTEHYRYMVLSVLEMIKAYDIDQSRADYLEIAKELCEWLIEVDDSPIHRLNLLQCIKRQRELTDEEILILSDLLGNDDEQIRLGANILLENKIVVQKQFNDLDKDKQDLFMQYPIFRFYREMYPTKIEGKVAP